MKKHVSLAIPVERITWEGLDVPVMLAADWFAHWLKDEPELEFVLYTPIQGTVHLERHDDAILVQGQLQGALEFTCSRCLDVFAQPLATTFELLLRVGGPPVLDPELELTAADLHEDYCPGEAVDLDGILREQILLALPLKPLCREDCLGLCRRCGANLNREACTCQSVELRTPLATLAKLKKE